MYIKSFYKLLVALGNRNAEEKSKRGYIYNGICLTKG